MYALHGRTVMFTPDNKRTPPLRALSLILLGVALTTSGRAQPAPVEGVASDSSLYRAVLRSVADSLQIRWVADARPLRPDWSIVDWTDDAFVRDAPSITADRAAVLRGIGRILGTPQPSLSCGGVMSPSADHSGCPAHPTAFVAVGVPSDSVPAQVGGLLGDSSVGGVGRVVHVITRTEFPEGSVARAYNYLFTRKGVGWRFVRRVRVAISE